MSKKYGFGVVPRLVDIISAIPDDYKKALLPKLRARPIRTASVVSLLGRCALSMLTYANAERSHECGYRLIMNVPTLECTLLFGVYTDPTH